MALSQSTFSAGSKGSHGTGFTEPCFYGESGGVSSLLPVRFPVKQTLGRGRKQEDNKVGVLESRPVEKKELDQERD